MPGYSKPFHVKVLESVIMTREDAHAFSEALRAAFPSIRFVGYDCNDKFFDFEAWRRAYEAESRAGKPMPSRLDFTRDPGAELPDYFPSLADVAERRFWVWVEPPKWRPRWRRSKQANALTIDNFPRLHFWFLRGGFCLTDPRRGPERQNDPVPQLLDLPLQPLPLDRNEVITLRGERMLGGWKKGDDTAKAFVQKVWRLLGKMSTNRLISVDERTREPVPPDGTAMTQAYVRAATDALRWARWRRHNYLEWGGHWYKPAGYFDR